MKIVQSAGSSPARPPAPALMHTHAPQQPHGPSRRSSNVDSMIADTLMSPHDADEGKFRPGTGSREQELTFSPAPPNGAKLDVRGYPQYTDKTHLAPLPFSGAVAPAISASSSSSSGTTVSPLEGGSASAPVPIRPANDGAEPLMSLSARGGGRGSKTPSRKAGAPAPSRRGITARAASNYGPKVVACNFCRGELLSRWSGCPLTFICSAQNEVRRPTPLLFEL